MAIGIVEYAGTKINGHLSRRSREDCAETDGRTVFKLYRHPIASKTKVMPSTGKCSLPLFLVAVFLGAMILGPLLYFGLSAVWPTPFHRAMDRALLISAVGALGLSWRRISLAQLWPWNGEAWKQLLLGYFIAAVSIQAMIGAYLVLIGFTSANLSAGEIAERMLVALVAALLAPPLEETVFRGFLQKELVRGLGWRAGWILAAVIFTLAHFFKIPAELDHEPVHLWSGATALGEAFVRFGHDLTQPENFGRAANLLLVGLILGGVFLRAGSLWMNAGLHSGWIFGLLLFTGLTRPVQPHVSFFAGDMLSTPATTVVLILTGLWLWRFYRHPSISPEPASGTGVNAL
jgi:membrane protease YdiL (CAAX protease family)